MIEISKGNPAKVGHNGKNVLRLDNPQPSFLFPVKEKEEGSETRRLWVFQKKGLRYSPASRETLKVKGSEMNLHIAQTQAAKVECATISKTAYQIISAQNSSPIMGCVQNTLVCIYLITETFLTPETVNPNAKPNFMFPATDGKGETPGYETMINRSDFMQACQTANISPERIQDLIKRAKNVYPKFVKDGRFTKSIPGKLAASIVFPRTFTWRRKTDVNERLPVVKIKNGILEPDSGPLCKKSIGGCGGAAIHPLWKMEPEIAAKVISELQFMTTVLITRIGFSMGISDCLPTKDTEINASISQALIKCEIINASNKDSIDKEREINGALNEAMSIAPHVAKTSMNKGDRNSLVIMKKSGAKGSDTNNGQISAFVGPQSMDGKRMACMLSGGTRALPHFPPGDNSPEARGFVKHSYLEGLTFQEMWFHAAAGRRGVVDTAMKSVIYDTKIMIDSPKGLQIVKIGEWIDNIISSGNIVVYQRTKSQGCMETCGVSKVFIPSTDHLGNIGWSLITAVTRHEPTEVLYEVTTSSGRSVVVTDSKSLLVWDFLANEFRQTLMKDVQIGYLLPVTKKLPEPVYDKETLLMEDDILEFNIARGNMKGKVFNIGNKRSAEEFFSLKDRQGCFLRFPRTVRDVILDDIVSIKKIDGKTHKYVYDLTVPDTTNFGLANGLHVVDTADKPRQVRVLSI